MQSKREMGRKKRKREEKKKAFPGTFRDGGKVFWGGKEEGRRGGEEGMHFQRLSWKNSTAEYLKEGREGRGKEGGMEGEGGKNEMGGK